jgi:hypothetical protein
MKLQCKWSAPIDIEGLGDKDKARIREIGLRRWMDEISRPQRSGRGGTKQCDVCGKRFEIERASAKYCSAKCRQRASRLSR